MRRSLILDVVVRLVFHSALLLGCFLEPIVILILVLAADLMSSKLRAMIR